MGSSSYFDYWKKYCPYIIVGKPMTDLCWLCKQNNSLLQRSANLPEDARIAQLHKQLGHLHNVQAERKVYNEMVDKSKADAKAAQLLSLGPRAPNSYRLGLAPPTAMQGGCTTPSTSLSKCISLLAPFNLVPYTSLSRGRWGSLGCARRPCLGKSTTS